MGAPRHIRLARPVADPERSAAMYCAGLGWTVLGSFADHAGFDGVMVGAKGEPFHVEFTRCRHHPVQPAPTPEDLLVLYVPGERDWNVACDRLAAAGFRCVPAFNPYWEARGRTYEDPDGYRVVLYQAAWSSD